jgi:hypothetical protein
LPAKKKAVTTTASATDKDVLVEYLTVADSGFPSYYPPSRHLKAAQAATQQSEIYTTTSKQSRTKAQKKLTAADVEILLKTKGLIGQNTIVSDNFEDPYTLLDKWRCHDAWRRDGTARRAVNVLADYVLGQRTKNTLDVNGDFATADEQNTALDSISNNTTYQGYKNQLDKINRDCHFDKMLTAAFIQCKVFGRALLIIQDDTDTGLPIALKLCSSMRLGRVFVDELTWSIVAVEYLDYQGERSIIPAQQMIYLTNLDFGISPYTLGFGYSDYETILDTSETNRQIWSVAIKEINKSYYAPYLIVKMMTKKRSLMQKAADNIKPGVPFIHNQDLTFQTIEMKHDLDKLMNEVVTNDKKIARDLAVPSPLIGHEAVTNRATTAAIIDAWSKSVLEKQRTWLKGIIEPQWIDRNLSILLSRTPSSRPLNQIETGPLAEQTGEQPSSSNLVTSQPQTNPANMKVSDMEFKIKLDFDPIPLDVAFEICQALDILIKDGTIDETKAREILKFDDIEERMIQKEQEAKALQQKQFKMHMDNQKQIAAAGQGQGPAGADGQKPATANNQVAQFPKQAQVTQT